VSRGVRRNALVKASERQPKERPGVIGVNVEFPVQSIGVVQADLPSHRPHGVVVDPAWFGYWAFFRGSSAGLMKVMPPGPVK
jgi:hypothetical protein